jgi:hypothetical protein
MEGILGFCELVVFCELARICEVVPGVRKWPDANVHLVAKVDYRKLRRRNRRCTYGSLTAVRHAPAGMIRGVTSERGNIQVQ